MLDHGFLLLKEIITVPLAISPLLSYLVIKGLISCIGQTRECIYKFIHIPPLTISEANPRESSFNV
jgi:hypothetical protein